MVISALQDTSSLPVESKQMSWIESVWPFSVLSYSPVSKSQTFIVASSLAETITLNTGWNITLVMGALWPETKTKINYVTINYSNLPVGQIEFAYKRNILSRSVSISSKFSKKGNAFTCQAEFLWGPRYPFRRVSLVPCRCALDVFLFCFVKFGLEFHHFFLQPDNGGPFLLQESAEFDSDVSWHIGLFFEGLQGVPEALGAQVISDGLITVTKIFFQYLIFFGNHKIANGNTRC